MSEWREGVARLCNGWPVSLGHDFAGGSQLPHPALLPSMGAETLVMTG